MAFRRQVVSDEEEMVVHDEGQTHTMRKKELLNDLIEDIDTVAPFSQCLGVSAEQPTLYCFALAAVA